MINIPKKQGNFYVKYDKNGKPEYGFEVKNNNIIKKFVMFSNIMPKTIILPKFEKDTFFNNKRDFNSDFFHLGNYIDGVIQISEKCFQGIKNVRIVVPDDESIQLEKGCFDVCSNIEFILPKNMCIKQVFRSYDSDGFYEKENWTLISDKRIKKNMGSWRNSYTVKDYEKEYNKNINFNVNQEFCVENGSVVKNNTKEL